MNGLYYCYALSCCSNCNTAACVKGKIDLRTARSFPLRKLKIMFIFSRFEQQWYQHQNYISRYKLQGSKYNDFKRSNYECLMDVLFSFYLLISALYFFLIFTQSALISEFFQILQINNNININIPLCFFTAGIFSGGVYIIMEITFYFNFDSVVEWIYS